jgi:regulator of protease activity HflC (stomatin/prohibitin superfamily)
LKKSSKLKNKTNMKTIKAVLIALVAVISISSCTRISPTEAGFRVSNSGDYRGVDSLPLLTGWQWYMPTQTYVVTIPTTMQHVVWSEAEQEGSQAGQHITSNCMGGSGFKVDVGVNYRVMPSKASKIYLKYKMDDLDAITQTFLRNIVRGSMQDISGHMTVDSMLNNLPGYEASVRKDLSARFDQEGFILDGFNILAMPHPVDANLATAINNKIIAKQNAETSKQQLEQSVAEANKKIAAARGDSAEAVIRAAGQAEAISKLQKQLTPEYNDYMRIQKWNGQYPSTMLGDGGGVLLNLNK